MFLSSLLYSRVPCSQNMLAVHKVGVVWGARGTSRLEFLTVHTLLESWVERRFLLHPCAGFTTEPCMHALPCSSFITATLSHMLLLR